MADTFPPFRRTPPRPSFRLAPEARAIVNMLRDVLHASVLAFDSDREENHRLASDREEDHLLARARERATVLGLIEMPRSYHLEARINHRWMLHVWSYRAMLPDADRLVKWAADKLAASLPRQGAADDDPDPPYEDGGGSGGSAELGIPVWWARKTLN